MKIDTEIANVTREIERLRGIQTRARTELRAVYHRTADDPNDLLREHFRTRYLKALSKQLYDVSKTIRISMGVLASYEKERADQLIDQKSVRPPAPGWGKNRKRPRGG